MNIGKLYFGKDDAETDFTSSGLLRDSFLRTSIYEQIKSGQKTLVIGRKGSGKSALCLMLNKQLSRDSASCIVTPDSISADEIRRFELVGLNEQQSKKLVWRYVFLTQICKFLINAAREEWGPDSKWPAEVKKVRQFLVDNREVDDLNFHEKFWRIINRINAKLTFGAFGNSLELSAEDAPNMGLQLGGQLDFLEQQLIATLSELGHRKLYIFVDKVDEIWNDDLSSGHMATGLLMAAKEVNAKFANVRCVVFLRSDIYEQLQFFDKDKLRGDEEGILWSSTTLPEMILERARASTEHKDMPQEELWSLYFPRLIDGQPISQFLVSHTLMRPRDLIQLCNLCADLARRDEGSSITQKHIKQALDVYSSWKLNDLIGEYLINYPYLTDVLILFSNTSFVIVRRRLEEIFGRAAALLKDRYPQYISTLSIDAVLNVLYGIGFIGVERNHKTAYYYEAPGTVEDADQVFVIHPAFRYALKATSSIDITPYVQIGDETRQRRQLSEIRRRRSPVRGRLEEAGRDYKDLNRIVDMIEGVPILFRNEGIPTEVVSEISRNFNAITQEIRWNLDMGNIAETQVAMADATQYLSDLLVKLQKDYFVASRAGFEKHMREVIYQIESMKERLFSLGRY